MIRKYNITAGKIDNKTRNYTISEEESVNTELYTY